MNLTYTQIFLLGYLIIFSFVSFILPIRIVKHAGKNPKGIIPPDIRKRSVIISSVFSIFSVIWIALIIVYIFNEQSVKWFLCITPMANEAFKIAGIIIMSMGLLAGILGIKDLGANFRIALPVEKTQLITTGIYHYSRNPIVLSIYLSVIGTFLIIPNVLMLITIIGNIICYDTKVRAEEVFLLSAHKDEYKIYKREVGRYFPKIKR